MHGYACEMLTLSAVSLKSPQLLYKLQESAKARVRLSHLDGLQHGR